MNLNSGTVNEIIESFVLVYGEKHREIITNKINNCLILLCGYKSSEEIQKIKNKINKKYLDKLYDKVSRIMNLSEDEKSYLFGDDIISNNSMISAFGTSAQKIIDVVEKTRANQMNTKQLLSIRDGFYKLSSIKEISIDIADELISIYDEIENQAKTEYFNSILNFEDNQNLINNIDFLEVPNFTLEFYDFEDQQHNGVQPNFVKDESGNTKLFPIINFSIVKNQMARLFGAPDYFDVLLIHEINHIIGMHLLEYKDTGNYRVRMGLLESDIENNKTKYYYANMIDEIFNQYIAKKVTHNLHEKGIYLIDNSKKSQIDGSSLYEMGEFLLKDFFVEFYDDLLEVYATERSLDEFYSKLNLAELKSLGLLVEEYLKRDDILEISEIENQNYMKKAREITTKIKKDLKKDKLIEIIKILDLNDLENISAEKIRSAYEDIIIKYNINNNNSEIFESLKLILLQSLNYAIDNIEYIKQMKNFTTNKKNAEMYGIKKSNIYDILNKKDQTIISILIEKLVESGMNINDVLKLLNSLEYGLVFPTGMRKLIEAFGEEFYDILIKFTEVSPDNSNEKDVLAECLQNQILIMEKSSLLKK